ncbi:MAG: response regulator [Sphingobium sp.]|nr:response regulator [Sphingobium sp.]
MNQKKPCALIVEDEFLIAEGLRVQLQAMGLDVCDVATTAEAAVELAEKHRPDLVLMDVRLDGEKDGVDAAMEIHRSIKTPVIFLTGSREDMTIARINEDHPAGVLFKPVSPVQLQRTIEGVLR